tara:strand:+ start:276 stop:557 length:282 start_codon:yes stop_codon:yes gene_type:complete
MYKGGKMKYYKDINNIVNDMLTIGNETEKREKELMEEEKIEVNKIEMPVYFYEDEETGEKVYDFEEMANELENRICKLLKRNVLITLSEVEEE